LHLCDKFRGIAKCTLGNGTSVFFWLDVWNDYYLKDSLPRLFSFAKNQKISVAQFLSEENMDNNFYLPLSQQANEEYQQLREIIHSLQKSYIHCNFMMSKKINGHTSRALQIHFKEDVQPLIQIYSAF